MEENNSRITGISHIGIAVPDIGEARKLYELLGFCSEMEEVLAEEDYGVRVLMMSQGSQRIELLEHWKRGKNPPLTAISKKSLTRCTTWHILCQIWRRR